MLKVWFGTEKNGVFNKGLYYMYCECHPTLVHQQQRKTYVKVGFCVYSHKSFDIKMKTKYDILQLFKIYEKIKIDSNVRLSLFCNLNIQF